MKLKKGDKINKLTALEDEKCYNHKMAFICECGREKNIIAGNARRGLTKTCGTCGNAKNTNIPKNGDLFGKWKVIEDVDPLTKLTTKILCECQCKNKTQKHIIITALNHEKTKQCIVCNGQKQMPKAKQISLDNHVYYHDRIGEIFGGFILMAYSERKITRTDGSIGYKRTFTLHYPNGHPHTWEDTWSTPSSLKNLKCWCDEENPMKRIRLKRNLTATDVAKRNNVTKTTVLSWEKQHTGLPEKRLRQLQEMYKMTEEEFQEVISFKGTNHISWRKFNT